MPAALAQRTCCRMTCVSSLEYPPSSGRLRFSPPGRREPDVVVGEQRCGVPGPPRAAPRRREARE